MTRGTDGGLHKTASYPSLTLEPLKAGSYLQKRIVKSPENRSLSQLFSAVQKETNPDSPHYSENLSLLTAKCAFPLLSPLVILGIAPSCTRFRRHTSYFLHYALGIFGFIAFFVLLNAGSILGQNQVVSPLLAILSPLAIAYAWATWRFLRI